MVREYRNFILVKANKILEAFLFIKPSESHESVSFPFSDVLQPWFGNQSKRKFTVTKSFPNDLRSSDDLKSNRYSYFQNICICK